MLSDIDFLTLIQKLRLGNDIKKSLNYTVQNIHGLHLVKASIQFAVKSSVRDIYSLSMNNFILQFWIKDCPILGRTL